MWRDTETGIGQGSCVSSQMLSQDWRPLRPGSGG